MIDKAQVAAAQPETADLRNARSARKSAPAAPAPDVLGRLPPHAPEAEQGVLGCILLSPNECLGECVAKIKSGAEVFYDLRHQAIYNTLVEMYDQRQPIDLITLRQRLKDKQLFDQVGGENYLMTLQSCVPSPANLPYYLDVVHQKYVLRKMIQTCSKIITRLYECEGDADELLDEVERDVLRVSEERVEATSLNTKQLVRDAFRVIEEYHARRGTFSGITTGYPDLDRLTDGLHAGEMIVIAARPGMGKTSIALNIAEHVAVDLKLPVAVFSLEMTAVSLMVRLICSRARINLRALRDGFVAHSEFPRLTGAAGDFSASPLYIDDAAGLSILQLRARARRLWQQYGIKLFIVDYLQLLHSTSRRAENRQQEIADISGGLKALAKELNVPIIVLSQLNREPEKRESGAPPRLSDLRESGAIEQDADVVGLLYKPGKPGADDEESGLNDDRGATPMRLLIAKQRNGPTGEIDLTFFRAYTRFESATKGNLQDGL
ncbi:MAG: replicative DNA helicase [Verrucomicrobiae bacterium]|nr:replicative DNA helicase [Verrucomicrobiae bacterium]MCX7723392.1 replicative DNA helicase [Verrucomicrobiae bacterium]MDW7980877.1 replicative DNA helicase [Verrucomicrobiales bacterium]